MRTREQPHEKKEIRKEIDSSTDAHRALVAADCVVLSVCVYVCMSMSTIMCVYVCIPVDNGPLRPQAVGCPCICVCVSVCLCVCVSVCARGTCVYTCMCICVSVCLYVSVCSAGTCLYVHIPWGIAHTHTHTHTHTHREVVKNPRTHEPTNPGIWYNLHAHTGRV